MSSKENIIELEGIEFKCFSLIEYSSLIQLLKLLAKKYKNLEEKLGILDGRMIEKDKRISELEIMLKGSSQSKDDKFPSISNDSKNDASKNKEQENKDKEREKQREKEKEKEREKEKSKDEILDENLDSNNITGDKNLEKENDKSKEDILENEDDKDKKDKDDERKNSEIEYLSQQKNDDSQNNLNKTESNINKSLLNEEKDKSKNDIDDIDNNLIENDGKKEEDKEDNLSENGSKFFASGKATTTNINKKELESGTHNLDDIKKKNSHEAEILEFRDTIARILKKLKVHDKQLNELSIKSNEHAIINKNIKKNKNDIEDINKKLNSLKNSIDDTNRKFFDFNEEFEKVKVKVQDFNVYDLIQGGSGDGNIDAAKLLVMNLENKIFKKFGIYDERNKKNDKDLFKMQEDIRNALAIVDGMKTTTKRNIDSLNELTENYNNTISNHENLINDIQRKLEQITNKVNSGPDFTGMKKEFDKKLKDLEERINSKLDLYLNKEPKDENNGPGLKAEDLAMIKDLRRRIGELESLVSDTFTRINADDMKKRISHLESEMTKKASKYEVIELSEKLKSLDEYLKDLNFKVDSLQQFTEKVRLDLAQIIKKIEFLSGEYSKLAFNKSGKNSDDGRSALDITKFIDLNLFNETKKDINNKFEKVRLGFEDLSREIEEILSKLAHTPTDKDFSQFQTIIKNLLDDLKISCNKKFADKFETAKSIKFLETQIKTIHETLNKKNEVGDNWLLAKKPINNYVCASCEANIRGELDKRTEFVPWNRYPIRDDKAYRLGHGFSRMLQMVNEDIIKSAGEKGYSSDEDKKLNIKNNNGDKTYSVNASVKLPKVNKRKPGVSSAFPAATEPNSNSSPYDGENGDNNNSNRPQIMRVVRKNKVGQTQSPSKNSEIQTQRNNEYSINEKNMPNNEDLPPINSNENDN